jgi:signal transduction histidine kinase
MILIVRRRTLLILIFSTVAFALAMSVLAYISVDAAGELSEAESKALAERILFVGIVGSSIVLAGLAAAAYDTIGLNSVLKRLSDMHRMSGDQLHLALRRFGSVGDQLAGLYDNINSLSDRKSTRIANMNSLLVTILARSDRNMLVVNAAGEVYQATAGALEYLELSSSDVIGQPIESIIQGETFSNTVAALSRSTGSATVEGPDESVAVIRVKGEEGLAAYYVYLLGNDAKEELKQNPPAKSAAEATAQAESEDSPQGTRDGESRKSVRSFLDFLSKRG